MWELRAQFRIALNAEARLAQEYEAQVRELQAQVEAARSTQSGKAQEYEAQVRELQTQLNRVQQRLTSSLSRERAALPLQQEALQREATFNIISAAEARAVRRIRQRAQQRKAQQDVDEAMVAQQREVRHDLIGEGPLASRQFAGAVGNRQQKAVAREQGQRAVGPTASTVSWGPAALGRWLAFTRALLAREAGSLGFCALAIGIQWFWLVLYPTRF